MKGSLTYVPGVGLVLADRKVAHSVTAYGTKDVTDEYECPDPPGGYPKTSRTVTPTLDRAGVLVIVGLLGACLIADGAILLLLAWILR